MGRPGLPGFSDSGQAGGFVRLSKSWPGRATMISQDRGSGCSPGPSARVLASLALCGSCRVWGTRLLLGCGPNGVGGSARHVPERLCRVSRPFVSLPSAGQRGELAVVERRVEHFLESVARDQAARGRGELAVEFLPE